MDASHGEKSTLDFYGSNWLGLLPFAVLLIGIMSLAIFKQGGIKSFWACGLIGVVIGMFFAKNKEHYCEAIMRGIADKNGIVIIIAWVFASILGKLMLAAGMVKGILWLGLSANLDGSMFVLMVYISAGLFSLGTGTSNGTALALSPVMFPAGIMLGADPTWLALAIMSGGVFGDNLAPISDTTIVSAYTQGAKMEDVVRSRFPLSLSAAIMAGIVLVILGGGGSKISVQALHAQTDPQSALLLVALAVVVVSALCRRHIIESLTYGIVSASAIGIAVGNITLADIFHIPAKKGDSTGLIQSGIEGVVGPVMFVIFVMAAIRIFVESGLMDRVLHFFESTVAKTARQAELTIFAMSALCAGIVTANGAALLLVGPTLVKPLGEKFHLTPARRANIMDCAVCSLFYMMPWALAVMVWYSAIESAATASGITAPPITIACMSPYPWALFLVLVFSMITGWGRRFTTTPAADIPPQEAEKA